MSDAAAAGVSAVADLRVVDVQVGTVTLSIRPLTVGKIPAFRAAGGERLLNLALTLPREPSAWLDVIGEDNGRVLDALAVASGISRKAIEDLQLDELVRLIAAVAEVNLDFFAHRLAPALADARRWVMRQVLAATQALTRSTLPSST